MSPRQPANSAALSPSQAARGVATAAELQLIRQAWLANWRQELLAPANALAELSDMLLKDAEERGQEQFLGDQRKVQAASRRLVVMLEALLTPGGLAVEPDELARRLRHDLRTPLAEILLTCETWLEEAADHLLDGFLKDLDSIHVLGRDLLEKLDAILSFGKVSSDPEMNLDAVDPAQAKLAQAVVECLPPLLEGRAGAGETGSILVVDDNQNIREMLARRLRQAGHQVAEAADGRQALALLWAQSFDLVLLDVMMPELNGLQVLEQLKADGRLRHVPVLMISAFRELDSVVRCLEMGAEDYLPKPCNAVLLRARVAACLEKKRLRDREMLHLKQVEEAAVRARGQLEQFFTRELYEELEANPDLLQLHDAEITVLFCDIRGFSRVSERLGPGRTVEWVADLMGELSQCVLAHHGVVVEYMGDELMAMWGAPRSLPDHPRQACAAALDMVRRLPELSQRWHSVLGEPTTVGIGLNTGVARVGNVGSRQKLKYGPLGNTVNLASRVQGATKYLGTQVIVTQPTRRGLGDGIAARRLCRVRVVNIAEPVDLYDLAEAGDPARAELQRRYEQALEQFEAGRFRAAIRVLGSILDEYPDDGPAPVLLYRAVSHLKEDPACFDPVWELPGK